MLGLPLIYEMALVATLVCLISWLMGRTLCKSRENEERADKKALQAANERLESLLVKKDAESQHLVQRLKNEQQAVKELQHQHNTTENLLAKSRQEHQESLASLQELTTYRTQFEELGKVHEDQSRQVMTLQETLRQTQNDMAQAVALNKALQAANERLESLLVKKDAESQHLVQRLKNEQQAVKELQHQHNTTENLLAKSRQEHQESLASLQELTTYRTQFEELGKVHEDQSRQVMTLQETLRQTQNDMAQAVALNAEQHEALETIIRQLRQEKQEAAERIAQQQTTVTTLEQKQQALETETKQQKMLILHLKEEKKHAEALTTEQQTALASYRQKQQTLENEAGNQNALIAQLRKQIAELQTENEAQHKSIETLNAKVNGYLQSVNSTNRRIAGMLDTLPGAG